MASIQEYLDLIKNAIYGKDVRQAIHDGIQQCYYDGKAGSTDLEARQRLDSAEGSISSLGSRMSTAEGDIVDLDARVDQIVAPSGEAPSAAEVADGRIVDGVTYNLIGDAIRVVNANLKSDMSIIDYKKNIFDYTTISTGKFLRHDIGTTPDAADWSVSDYIDVSGIQKFATGYIKHIAFFDSNKNFISGSGFQVDDGNANVITVYSGAKYVRFDWYVPKLEYYGFTEETIQVIPNRDAISATFHEYNEPYDISFAGESAYDEKYIYWRGKRILWLGSSIPEGNRRPAYGYPDILADKLECTVINNAVGGSMAMSGRQMLVSDSDPNGLVGQSWGWTKGFTQPLSLKNDFINNWSTWKTKFTGSPEILDETVQSMILASSYETALDPYLTDANKCDLYVLNFGWNESTPELYSRDENNKLYCDWTYQYIADDASNINSLDPYRYNTKTFRGAYNWIIRRILSAQPQASILIIGEGEYAQHNNLVNAQEKCAYENACQYIPLWKIMGLNQRKITANKRVNASGQWTSESYTGTVQYCRIYDGTHPQGWMTERIADYLEAQFRYNIRV